jgi:hypothetical protein
MAKTPEASASGFLPRLAAKKENAKPSHVRLYSAFFLEIANVSVRLYAKSGFKKAGGTYEEKFDDGFVLHEFGYEIRT